MTRPYSFQREILLIVEEKLHIFHVQVRNNLILVLHVKKNSGSRGRQSHSRGVYNKNSLKVPKGSSEAINQKTLSTKRKLSKRQTIIDITLHRKLKIRQHERH